MMTTSNIEAISKVKHVEDVPCSKCGQKAGQRCFFEPNSFARAHKERWELFNKLHPHSLTDALQTFKNFGFGTELNKRKLKAEYQKTKPRFRSTLKPVGSGPKSRTCEKENHSRCFAISCRCVCHKRGA